MTAQLTEEQKKEVFRILVETQDGGTAVLESREQVARRFELAGDAVIEIERAGITNRWPPLDAVAS